jgi:hypothetical protein
VKHPNFFIAALGCSLVLTGAAQAADSGKAAEQRLDQQMGSEGNAMGVPVPGSVSDIENTEKQPDTSKIQSSRTIPQMPYSVEGEILKIDGQNYDIQGGNERVSLIVNKDTNLDCARVPEGRSAKTSDMKGSDMMKTDRVGAKEQAPQASEQQRAQGQRQDETARGAGFQIGSCDFKQGDRVKAEVDDNGRVTTLKYLADSSASQSQESGMGMKER